MTATLAVGDPFVAGVDRTHPAVAPGEIQENLDHARKELSERVPRLYRDAVVTVPEVREWVRELVEGAAVDRPYAPVTYGRSLLLSGLSGRGKTHNAYAALRALGVSGVRCSWLVVNAVDMFDELRPHPGADPREFMHRLKAVTLLVVDDVGVEKDSVWTEQQLYRVVNHRAEHVKPTLVTTNLDAEGIRSVLSPRVLSRLVGMATYAKVTGPDHRVGVA